MQSAGAFEGGVLYSNAIAQSLHSGRQRSLRVSQEEFNERVDTIIKQVKNGGGDLDHTLSRKNLKKLHAGVLADDKLRRAAEHAAAL